MALGTNHIILSEVANFVPELWSDEVIASYKSNLVIRNLVRTLNHKGRKGDTIRIPTPARGSAANKVAETQVTLIQHGSDAGLVISIDKHKEYSRLIEDIVDIQALGSLRRFYTDDAGYAIAKRVDTDLIFEAAAGGNGGGTATEDAANGNLEGAFANAVIGDGQTAWDRTASTNVGNASDLTDLGIRRLIKSLDDVDAPMMGRYLVVPPVVKADMLGIAKYTQEAFVGERGRDNSIRNGLIADVYGVEVYVSNNLPSVEDAGNTADQKLVLFFQRDALVLVEQAGVRTQTQYKQEYLGDLFTADMLYGVKTLRSSSIKPVVVPSTFTDG